MSVAAVAVEDAVAVVDGDVWIGNVIEMLVEIKAAAEIVTGIDLDLVLVPVLVLVVVGLAIVALVVVIVGKVHYFFSVDLVL